MDLNKFQKESLEAHNAYRKAHGAQPLKLDPAVSMEAQKWAEHLANIGSLKHSNTKLGENVAYTSGSATGFSITKMWYDEVKDYSWVKHGSANGRAVGHFTQVVWKDTTHAGFGIAKGSRGTFAVGTYKPAGNWTMPGYYEKNVGQKSSEPNVPAPDLQPGEESQPSGEMPKPGTSVETKTEIFVEDGVRKKKTTTITTTVTEKPKGVFTTSTSTQIQTEILRGEEEVTDKIEKLETSDDDGTDDDDSSDDEKENDMSRLEKHWFRRECLREINRLRRNHGVYSRLRRSSTLQRTAQRHARSMLRSGNWSFIEGAQHGQAVAERRPRPSGENVAGQWHEQRKSSGNAKGIVWDDSTEAGIGIASNKDGKTFIIALFDPRKDAVNQFVGNVIEE